MLSEDGDTAPMLEGFSVPPMSQRDCANEGEGVLDHCAFWSEVSTAFKFESSTRAVFAGGTDMATSQWSRWSPAKAGISRLVIQYCPAGTLSKAAEPLRLLTAIATR